MNDYEEDSLPRKVGEKDDIDQHNPPRENIAKGKDEISMRVLLTRKKETKFSTPQTKMLIAKKTIISEIHHMIVTIRCTTSLYLRLFKQA
mmetsp:Transcript_5668/g.7508  ORF Transcript_5668/g.7508 Transcript_5668/m.7508 type:complete len:90 (-) Transcript_5668:33-302(-)|eukprot:491432-Ditylum_brightwellii.AAC.1